LLYPALLKYILINCKNTKLLVIFVAMSLHFKTIIVTTCKEVLDTKIKFLNNALQYATDAGNNETKSTAGDKHETGRAMMQLEQEKLGNQLVDLESQKNEFDKIDFSINHKAIANGSLIETNNEFFLIASAIGKLKIDQITVFVISKKSPLALILLGLKNNDTVDFNGMNYFIKNHW
jgi:transcription elongation GreA/GreB family factor